MPFLSRVKLAAHVTDIETNAGAMKVMELPEKDDDSALMKKALRRVDPR
jgi:hypothetical protein